MNHSWPESQGRKPLSGTGSDPQVVSLCLKSRSTGVVRLMPQLPLDATIVLVIARMPEVESRASQLEVLPERECVLLLRSHDLGRIGLVDREAHPLIFPVNYFFDEGVVVFRTAPGSKLQLAPGVYVCFEVDGYDPKTLIGWSVLVKGIAHDITSPRGMPTSRMHYWPVHPKAPGRREHWIGIWANEITGRRFRSWAPEHPG